MKLRRVVLILLGGMSFCALLSAETIVRSGSGSHEQLIFSGQPLKYSVFKPGRNSSADQSLIVFKQLDLKQLQSTVRRGQTRALRNGLYPVSHPEARKLDLGSMKFDAPQAAPQGQKTDASLRVFAVTPIIPALD